MIKIFI